MAKRLFIGRLPTDVTEIELAELFAQAGEVVSVSIKFDHGSGKSRGFGFVQMRDNEAAAQAIASLNGALLKGRNIRVVEAEKRGAPSKRPTGSSDPITTYEPATSDPVAQETTQEKAAGRRLTRWMMTGVLGLVLTLALILLFATPQTALDPHTVLIVPFKTFSGESTTQEQASYLGHAMAEAIAINLAFVPELRTLPVPAATEYTNADQLAASARRQGAGLILTGTLRRTKGRVHASITAIDAKGNRVLWGVRQEGPAKDVERLAAQLSRSIVNKVGLKPPVLYRYVTNLVGADDMSKSPLVSRAAAFLRVGDFSSAMLPTSALVRQYPTDYAAWTLRAHALALRWDADSSPKNRGQLEAALVRLDETDPDNPYSAVYRAFLQTRNGGHNEAISRFTKLMNRVDISPAGRAWILRHRASAKQVAGMDGRIADLKESQRLDPTNPWTLSFLSSAYQAEGEFEDALRLTSQALSVQPKFWRNHESMGHVLRGLGNMSEATAAFARACDLGKIQRPCSLYSISELKLGNTKAAEKASRVAERMPPSIYGNYNLACYAALQGKTEKALQHLRQSVQLGLADDLIRSDDDLESLRNTDEYKALVAEVDQRLKR